MARANKTTGIAGIIMRADGKYIARRKESGQWAYVGIYKTLDDAIEAQAKAPLPKDKVAEPVAADVRIKFSGGRYVVSKLKRGRYVKVASVEDVEDAEAIARQQEIRSEFGRVVMFDEPPAIGTPIVWKGRMWKLVGVAPYRRMDGDSSFVLTWADGRGQIATSGLVAGGLTVMRH